MALPQPVATSDFDESIDEDTGIPIVELQSMLDLGLAQLQRGEGVELDAGVRQSILGEIRRRAKT